eukprot:6194634-Pleurochrysis_carterae.AAC.1
MDYRLGVRRDRGSCRSRERSAERCRRRVAVDGATRTNGLVPGRQRGKPLAPLVRQARRGRVRAVLARPAPARGPSRRRMEWERPSAAIRLRGA